MFASENLVGDARREADRAIGARRRLAPQRHAGAAFRQGRAAAAADPATAKRHRAQHALGAFETARLALDAGSRQFVQGLETYQSCVRAIMGGETAGPNLFI